MLAHFKWRRVAVECVCVCVCVCGWEVNTTVTDNLVFWGHSTAGAALSSNQPQTRPFTGPHKPHISHTCVRNNSAHLFGNVACEKRAGLHRLYTNCLSSSTERHRLFPPQRREASPRDEVSLSSTSGVRFDIFSCSLGARRLPSTERLLSLRRSGRLPGRVRKKCADLVK